MSHLFMWQSDLCKRLVVARNCTRPLVGTFEIAVLRTIFTCRGQQHFDEIMFLTARDGR